MYSLLLMLSWLPHAVSAGAPPAPENVRVKSVNFNHVLLWEKGADTSPEVTYRVSFKTDRGRCTVVPGCERVIEPLVCNLTEAWSDPDETYHVQVTALQFSEQSNSPWKSFDPTRETELQPPVLRVAPCNKSLCVEMDSPVPHLHSSYEYFWYQLKIESSTSQELIPIRSLEKKEIPGVIEGSQYCVSIRFLDDIVGRESKFSPAQCVIVPSPIQTSAVLSPVLLPVLALLLLAVSCTVFMCLMKPVWLKKPTLPSVLTSVFHTEEKLEVSCHPAVSSLLLIEPAPHEGQTEYCSSETDSSEDEQDSPEASDITNVVEYRSKASLCSVEVQVEGLDEVDLRTLTFSRDKDTDSAVLLSEMEHAACLMVEEQAEPEEEFNEDCCQTGYMSR